LKTKAEEVIIANIDSEINYIFTNDEFYLEQRTKLIPTQPAQPNPKDHKKGTTSKKEENAPLMDASGSEAGPTRALGTAATDNKGEREKLKKEAEKMFVKELRLRVDEYFRIVVKTLRVQHFLFRKSSPRTLDTSWSVSHRKRCSILCTTNCLKTIA
jgi:hypothetical protein